MFCFRINSISEKVTLPYCEILISVSEINTSFGSIYVPCVGDLPHNLV